MALVIAWKVELRLGTFEIQRLKVELEITTHDNKLTKCRGRARGLVAVWEEERREKNRCWMNTCLTPGCGRAETLKLLTDMVTKNEQKPGIIHSQALGRGFITPDTNNKPCNLDSVWT